MIAQSACWLLCFLAIVDGRRVCFDSLRSVRLEEDNLTPEELNIMEENNPMREAELKDEVNQVKRIIRTLPKQQQQIVVMRDVNDCSYEEIEQATGLSSVNIRVLLSRTRKKIREQFNIIRNHEHR